ncbi:hypothetical protein [Bradyrhizobium sp. B117]|uniref:hypothetical protein n=1 Tax=Bradyrhizobium sp. B117 TaxID=3140246 RepID=UPI003182E95F
MRAGFISGELALDGDEYSVTIEEKITERINLRQMRKTIDSWIWSPFLISSRSVYVKTTRKTEASDDLKTRRRIHT